MAVRSERTVALWLALDPEEDLIGSRAMDLVMTRDTLLKNLVDLFQAMGLPVNPTFYLSLEDWHLEYAGNIFAELDSMIPKPGPPGAHS
jgi:hypothetical protein